jgi:hypothetical protein
VGLLKRKIPMPEASRFDRLDDESLYLLVEHAFGMANESLHQATQATDEKVSVHLHNADTALSDAQGAVRALLRRRLAIALNL